ncbi:MAG TPA: hypothetical protein ENN84_03050 [Candidatus Marinimicrobia bacterium]|nr:hypothetical protein [Candidatus Neomarinimicrobiota bacterium]
MAKLSISNKELAEIIFKKLPAAMSAKSVTPLDDGTFEIELPHFNLLLIWKSWTAPDLRFDLRMKNLILHRIMDTPISYLTVVNDEFISFQYPELRVNAEAILRQKAGNFISLKKIDYKNKQLEIDISLR